jgi:hypothetical protein
MTNKQQAIELLRIALNKAHAEEDHKKAAELHQALAEELKDNIG